MEIINSFASKLLHLDTVDETVWTVAQNVISELDYVDCIIYLMEDNRLIQKAAYGPKNPREHQIKDPIILHLGEGICGLVAQSGKSMIIRDTSKDPRYKVDDAMRYSEISVPIIFQDQVIGVIDSEHPEKNFFTEEDQEILETIASMLAVKIKQAEATQELKKNQADLKKKVKEKTQKLENSLKKLKEYNKEIEESNRQKEILLKEIHHRVKNNLQIVSSLMNLHMYKTENGEAQDVFNDCRNRVNSMAVIHEQLYGEQDMYGINSKSYITEIGQELLISYDVANEINIEYEVEPMIYSLDISVPFGLILNELLVNSFKYAFPENKGVIRILNYQEGDDTILKVEDDGIGYDPKTARNNSLGLELIEALTEQLNGSFTISGSKKGTVAVLRFRNKND
ncbi:MAG: GAF domain-containing protein [Crocinitomicaceae bacterium]|nr:GAF domain-containing protein [Crocinitomicaceae bacterium]